MKKSLFAAALVGMLGLASCSDTFEPNVDFGDKTYINDYSKLVEAVNDLNKTLDERFAALNNLVKEGLYSIKVAVDENTGAITTQTTAMKDGLGTLNTTLLNGFTATSEAINSNGDKIVSAINANGDLIALHLDKNGQLISAQIETSTTEIIKALNSNTATLGDKLAAINTTINTGLTDLNVKVGEIGSQLKVTNNNLNTMNGHLGNIDADIKAQTEKIGELSANVLNGFNTLNSTINANGDKIVSAINKNGEVISLQIKSTGELLKATIEASTADIIAALKDNNEKLSAKLDALNSALTNGLANLTLKVGEIGSQLQVTNNKLDGINGSIEAQTKQIGDLSAKLLDGFDKVNAQLTTLNNGIGQIKVSIDEHNAAITKISADLAKQLKAMQDSLATVGGKLIYAINNNGDVIANAVNNHNCIDSTMLVATVGKLSDNITSLKDAIANGSSSIVESLKEFGCKCDQNTAKNIIFDDEDKNDDGSYNKVYVSPDVWNAETKEAIKAQLKTKEFTPNNKQSHCSGLAETKEDLFKNHDWKNHAVFEETAKSDEEVVVNSTVEKDGKQYYECVKVYKYLVYSVKIKDGTGGCGWPRTEGIFLADATGGDFNNGRWIYFWKDNDDKLGTEGTWFTNIKITLYDDATGVYVADPALYIYSTTAKNDNYIEGNYNCSGK